MILKYPYGNHIGEQFGHLLAVAAIESDAETGDPVIYDCKCMKCGKEHIRVLDRDLLSYKVRSCGCSDRNDLTGMKFTRLTAIKRVENSPPSPSSPSGHIRYLCKCACGNEKIVYASALLAGLTQSCGCLQRERAGSNILDIVGRTFGRLTVLSLSDERTKTRQAKFLCRCECGNTVTVLGSSLISGNTRSCGCLKNEMAAERHRKWTDEENLVMPCFYRMKSRCYNKNNPDYKYWGGRGIRICDEWLNDPRSFIYWAFANGFKPGLTIERRDCDKNYEPSNCCWIPQSLQTHNMRSNIRITINGVTKILSEWAEFIGINYGTLHTVYFVHGYDACAKRIEKACNERGLLCSSSF